MDLNPHCPICRNNSWDVIGNKIYRKSETDHLSEYAKVRYEVLFKVWLPDKNQAEFSSILYNKCGFVAYKPRPTSKDLEEKYQFLAHHPNSRNELSAALVSDKILSEELFNYLSKYIEKQYAEILDYGGGNGRLMPAFLEEGHHCNLVDYIEETLPNMLRLGSTIDDIPKNSRFDIIICSHVLEHLADPAQIISRLSEYLGENGFIYVEVPLEIWDCVPLPVEPVNHINFFSPQSLRVLLQLSGLEVIICEQDLFTTEQGDRAFAVKSIARLAKTTKSPETLFKNGAKETKQLIFPTFSMKLYRMIKYPHFRKTLFNNWAKAHLPRTFFWRFFP